MPDKIRISPEDLADPAVDAILDRQNKIRAVASRNRHVGVWRRVLFSSVTYGAAVAALGALIGWAAIEPYFEDVTAIAGIVTLSPAPSTWRGAGTYDMPYIAATIGPCRYMDGVCTVLNQVRGYKVTYIDL